MGFLSKIAKEKVQEKEEVKRAKDEKIEKDKESILSVGIAEAKKSGIISEEDIQEIKLAEKVAVNIKGELKSVTKKIYLATVTNEILTGSRYFGNIIVGDICLKDKGPAIMFTGKKILVTDKFFREDIHDAVYIAFKEILHYIFYDHRDFNLSYYGKDYNFRKLIIKLQRTRVSDVIVNDILLNHPEEVGIDPTKIKPTDELLNELTTFPGTILSLKNVTGWNREVSAEHTVEIIENDKLSYGEEVDNPYPTGIHYKLFPHNVVRGSNSYTLSMDISKEYIDMLRFHDEKDDLEKQLSNLREQQNYINQQDNKSKQGECDEDESENSDMDPYSEDTDDEGDYEPELGLEDENLVKEEPQSNATKFGRNEEPPEIDSTEDSEMSEDNTDNTSSENDFSSESEGKGDTEPSDEFTPNKDYYDTSSYSDGINNNEELDENFTNIDTPNNGNKSDSTGDNTSLEEQISDAIEKTKEDIEKLMERRQEILNSFQQNPDTLEEMLNSIEKELDEFNELEDLRHTDLDYSDFDSGLHESIVRQISNDISSSGGNGVSHLLKEPEKYVDLYKTSSGWLDKVTDWFVVMNKKKPPSYVKPNKKFLYRNTIIMSPSGNAKDYGISQVTVFLDTSGSMSEYDKLIATSIIFSANKIFPKKTNGFEFNTALRELKFSNGRLIDCIKSTGGTEISLCLNYIKDKKKDTGKALYIIITDGGFMWDILERFLMKNPREKMLLVITEPAFYRSDIDEFTKRFKNNLVIIEVEDVDKKKGFIQWK